MKASSLRVIGGALRGRRIAGPTWEGLRPTSDRLRETVFNVLSARVTGARWVDACAGTGAIGIEALSRGAAHVTFLETDPRARALIHANLDRCGIGERYTMSPRGVQQAARALPPAGADIIYLDPPYDAADLDAQIFALADVLAPGGVLVVEHATRRASPEQAGSVVRVRTLVSGDSTLSFYERQDS